MSENLHTRANQLFAQSLVEGLVAGDQAWLEQHLRECPACSAEAASTRDVLSAWRTMPLNMPSDLAARTQIRIRLRAQEAAQNSNGGVLLWIITAASWLLGVVSAPFVWRVFAWVGAYLNLPKPVQELAFVLWWTVPPLVAVGVVLYQRAVNSRIAGRPLF
jgi:hypothetical protein